jgi:serine/threonine-protein phosphatase 6 regulatory ankyrin repeat subunit B
MNARFRLTYQNKVQQWLIKEFKFGKKFSASQLVKYRKILSIKIYRKRKSDDSNEDLYEENDYDLNRSFVYQFDSSRNPISNVFPDAEKIKLFLDAGVDINSFEMEIIQEETDTETDPMFPRKRVPEYIRPLFISTMNENLKIVKLLVENGADVIAINELSCRGNSYPVNALMIALEYNYTEIAKFLLENVKFKYDIYLNSALIDLSSEGNIVLVKLLLENGVNANARLGDRTALLEASYNGHLEIVKLLLEYGVDVNAKINYDISRYNHEFNFFKPNPKKDYTVLLISVINGCNLELVKLFLDNGSDVDARTYDGETALIISASKGQFDIVNLLISYGADVNLQDNEGDTVLIKAIFNNYLDIVKLLLLDYSGFIDVNAKNNKGNTALIGATVLGNLEIVKLLLEKDVNINAKDRFGNTILVWASSEGRFELVKLLLENGADIDINATNNEGDTALLKAITNGHLEIVKLLLDNKALINFESKHIKKPLIAASGKGCLKTVKLLIEKGAEINAKETFGTALLFASLNGHFEIVKYLLDSGADANVKSCNNESALRIATRNNHSEIVKLLKDYGAI